MADADLHQRIKKRAYELWEQEGHPGGRAEEHWRRAEAELAGIRSSEGAPPGTPGAGEQVCAASGGSGRRRGRPCKTCGGTGRIVEVPQP
jgi:hypothetical protein